VKRMKMKKKRMKRGKDLVREEVADVDEEENH
jgi:hypothetical protein